MHLKKVLITDDDEDILNLISVCLKDSDLVVELCESGEEALKKIPLFKPDLIIFDLIMPKMDGISTFNALKKDVNTVSIPVIFMTAKKEEKDINNLLEIGAIGVIFKPFESLDFEEQLKRIWNKKIVRNQKTKVKK